MYITNKFGGRRFFSRFYQQIKKNYQQIKKSEKNYQQILKKIILTNK